MSGREDSFYASPQNGRCKETTGALAHYAHTDFFAVAELFAGEVDFRAVGQLVPCVVATRTSATANGRDQNLTAEQPAHNQRSCGALK